MQALTAAAIMLKVGRACRDRNLGEACGCAKFGNSVSGWTKAGGDPVIQLCSDNLEYGRHTAEEFLRWERGDGAFKWMRIHNINVGMQVRTTGVLSHRIDLQSICCLKLEENIISDGLAKISFQQCKKKVKMAFPKNHKNGIVGRRFATSLTILNFKVS